MLPLFLSTLGLPLEGVGLLLAIDPILDMRRTATNVAGQALVPTVAAKREGILEVEQYSSAQAAQLFVDDEEEAAEGPEQVSGRPEGPGRVRGRPGAAARPARA